jgi:hypothetical protein
MRIIKIFLILLVAIVFLSLIGISIFLKTFNIDAYKPQFEAALSGQIGKSVKISDIDLEIKFSGIHLVVKKVSLGNDQDQKDKKFAEVERISAKIDFIGYLRNKELILREVEIESPRLLVVRQKDGTLNIPGNQSIEQAAPVSRERKEDQVKDGSDHVPDLSIDSIHIKDGFINYIDHSGEPVYNIEISPVDLRIEGFTTSSRPFSFNMQTGLFSERAILFFDGNASFDATKGRFTLSDTRLNFSLSKVQRESLIRSFPQLMSAGLDRLSGDFILNVKKMIVEPDKTFILNGDGSLRDALISLSSLNDPIRNIDIEYSFDGTDLIIKELVLEIGAGKIYGKGTINEYLSSSESVFSIQVENVPINSLLSPEMEEIAEGAVKGHIQGRFNGLETSIVLPTMKAEGVLEAESIKLKDVNLIKVIFEKIAMIPNIGERVIQNLPEATRNRLEIKETEFKQIQAPFSIEQGQVNVNRLKVMNPDFEFSALINYDLSGAKIKISPELKLSPELSKNLISGTEELRLLVENNDEKINVPLTEYAGHVNDLRIYPDIEKMTKQVFINKGKQELRKAIFNWLEIEDEGPSPIDTENSDNSSEPSSGLNKSEEKQPLEKIIFDEVLNTIFGE